MIRDKFLAEGSNPEGPEDVEEQSSADDYLSKLAQSILSKEKSGPRVPAHAQPRPSEKGSSSRSTPPPAQRPASTPPPVQARMPKTPPPSASGGNAKSRGTEWVREVSFQDTAGNLIPGTILLFEDGTVGVFKEENPVKEYDIVYVLNKSGHISPQGMPLDTYDVEPIGRLSQGVFEQLVKSGRWERDMMVFHLLKYKDHVHIPPITNEDEPIGPPSGDRVTKMSVRNFEGEESQRAQVEGEKPAFERGRRLTIEFGPQKWEAVYWGKDELGHVVAHNTHDKWALMHLDLGRFKDSITLGDFASEEEMKSMERDFTAA